MPRTAYVIQGYYAPQTGWEDVTEEPDLTTATETLQTYDREERGYAHRIDIRQEDDPPTVTR
jgi:hypothetical protein